MSVAWRGDPWLAKKNSCIRELCISEMGFDDLGLRKAISARVLAHPGCLVNSSTLTLYGGKACFGQRRSCFRHRHQRAEVVLSSHVTP